MTKIMVLGTIAFVVSMLAAVTMPSPAVLAWDAARHAQPREVARYTSAPETIVIVDAQMGTTTTVEVEAGEMIIFASR